MNLPSPKGVLFILYVLLSASVPSGAQVSLDPPAWELGRLEPDRVYRSEVVVRNEGGDDVEVRFISTCDCLSVEPSAGVIAPGGDLLLGLAFDTGDDRGEFEKILIVRTIRADGSKEFYSITGDVAGEDAEADRRREHPASQGGVQRSLSYFYTPGCRSCTDFLEKELPRLSRELNIEVNLERRDLTDPDDYRALEELMAERKVPWERVPVLVADNVILQGEKEIARELEPLLKGEFFPAPAQPASPRTTQYGKLIIPILAAGLLDGINPCAFTTLIFLLSALAAAGKSRREILLIGCFFTFAVYVTYYLVGAGFFGALRAASSFWRIGQALRWLLAVVLLFFSTLSLVDYHRIRRGRSSEILLQLPGNMKKRIHRSVRTYTRSSTLVGSSLMMGFLISLFELGCTGQIYFPTLTYMIRRGGGTEGWILLALYNAAFILPLVVVFFLVYRGLASERITEIFKAHLGRVKLVTALLFLILGILTIIT